MSHKPNVLIIDDEPDLIELVSLTLGRMSLNTESVNNFVSVPLNISELPSGIYEVVIKSETAVATRKLQVVK